MVILNPRQKTAAAFLTAVLVTLLGLHNPFQGYVTDHEEHSIGGYVWETQRSDCTPQLRAEVSSIENVDPYNPRALMEVMGNSRRGSIYKQCMTFHKGPPTVVDHPFLAWRSIGAVHPYVETMVFLQAGLGFVFLWGIFLLYALRSTDDAV